MLTVDMSVLEAHSCRWQPHAKERLTVERCLALADRRLTAAVKLLATVRRVPVEDLLRRVRVAQILDEAKPTAGKDYRE